MFHKEEKIKLSDIFSLDVSVPERLQTQGGRIKHETVDPDGFRCPPPPFSLPPGGISMSPAQVRLCHRISAAAACMRRTLFQLLYCEERKHDDKMYYFCSNTEKNGRSSSFIVENCFCSQSSKLKKTSCLFLLCETGV